MRAKKLTKKEKIIKKKKLTKRLSCKKKLPTEGVRVWGDSDSKNKITYGNKPKKKKPKRKVTDRG